MNWHTATVSAPDAWPATAIPWGRRLGAACVLALACWGSAWAGWWLSTLPMSYASGVWPAAGVGLAGLLLLGSWAWPAVWLGRLVFEAGFAPVVAAPAAWPDLLFSASAATAQAGAGAWLLRRCVRWPTRLRRGPKLLRLLGLAAASAVVNASVSMPWWLARERVAPEGAWAQWATWISGDMLGTVLVLPLVLLWATPGGWRDPRKWQVSAWALLGWVTTLWATQQVVAWESVRLQGQFRHQANQASRALHDNLAGVETVLGALRRWPRPGGAGTPDGASFMAVAGALSQGQTSLRATAWVDLREPATGQQALVVAWRASAPRQSWPQRQAGDGLDDAVRRAWSQARADGPLASVLWASPEGRQLLLALMPVPDRPSAVLALVDVAELMAQTGAAWWFDDSFVLAGLSERLHGLNYRLEAVSPHGVRLLHGQAADRFTPPPLERGWLQAGRVPEERFDHLFGQLDLSLWVAGQADFWQQNPSWRPGLAFTLGMLATGLLTTMALVATGRRELLESLVAKKTVELDQSLLLLEDAVEGYQQQSERLKLVLRSTPAGFLAFDGDHRVAFANEALSAQLAMPLAQLLEADRAAVMARLCSLCPQQTAQVQQLLGEDTQAEAAALRLTIAPPDQPERVLAVTRSASTQPALHSVFLVADVTEAARLERSKSEFIAHVAHEIRTPLTSITGYTQLLQHRSELDASQRQAMLQEVTNKAASLNALMAQVLDVAELENLEPASFKRQPADLAQVVQQALQAYKSPAGYLPPQWRPVAGPALVCAVHSRKLALLLRHLLANAQAFSAPSSPVWVSVSAAPGTGAPGALLQVADQGQGMGPEALALAFERFYRADTSGEKPGFGLGLSIVRRVAELHGGHVQLHSQLGVGTVACVWLPCCQAEEALSPAGGGPLGTTTTASTPVTPAGSTRRLAA